MGRRFDPPSAAAHVRVYSGMAEYVRGGGGGGGGDPCPCANCNRVDYITFCSTAQSRADSLVRKKLTG